MWRVPRGSRAGTTIAAEPTSEVVADGRDGCLFGVWNTDGDDGVRVLALGDGRYRLAASKTFCSGAGYLGRALVTGHLVGPEGPGGWQMCVVPMDSARVEIDRSSWQPLGMRATASYRVDFGGVELAADCLLGVPDDYHRDPWYRGGAIRFAAVQLGGARALFDAAHGYLRDLSRADDPYQRAPIGEAAVALESGSLWLRGAARVTDGCWIAGPGQPGAAGQAEGDGPAEGDRRRVEAVVAYANMTRLAIERVCLAILDLVERSIGARGLMRPHPFERIGRDLRLDLRQAAPDATLAAVGRRALEMGDG